MDDGTLQHADLIELNDDLQDVRSGGEKFKVQFNPETLKLSYSNQIQSQSNASSPSGAGGGGAGNQGAPARQFVGQSTTKLSMQLWFDVSAATSNEFMVDDVRRLTAKVLYFMVPRKPQDGSGSSSQLVPPGIRFAWGGFLFDGMVESAEESVEFFSAEGKALRASIALNLIKQTIWINSFKGSGAESHVNKVPGTQPLKSAKSGQSLQQMAPSGGSSSPASGSTGSSSLSGSGGLSATGLSTARGVASGSARSWQQIAIANGIENPRSLKPGQLIDLQAKRAQIITE